MQLKLENSKKVLLFGIRYRKYLFFLLLLFFLTNEMSAKHIIGGVMYYEYVGLGNNNTQRYRIVLKMYRDCVPEANKADFDGVPGGQLPALFAVYRGTQLINGSVDFGVPAIRKLNVEITNQCLVVPPGVCVEEGIYSVILELPVSTQSYYITYQRCCRNNSITNLTNPGSQGATFYAEITALAQTLKNSSPQFDNFPPIAICANFPLTFDHSGTDNDGDSLVYSMCAPLLGGGNNEFGNTGCDVVAPDPDCPPPYDPVLYRSPYTGGNPLGGSPAVSIDPVTGQLSGVPTTTGQFVVGICLHEYRNGQLLSVTRRDFQFNVTDCAKTVNALIKAGEVEGKNIDVRLCGETAIDLLSTSTVESNIFNYKWELTGNGHVFSNATKNFRATFPDLGVYTGYLALNPGLPCSDTAYMTFRIFPDIRADYTHTYDTCLGKVITFTNQSLSDAGPITATQWLANGNQFANTFHAQFNTLAPDYYNMTVVVEDQNMCRDSLTKPVPFFPIPVDELVRPADLHGCNPFEVTFDRPNNYITEQYDISWDFGDGHTGTGLTPTHTYTTPGTYDIHIEVVNHFGCRTDAHFPNVVTNRESPTAAFTFTPAELSNLKPTMTIIDQSQLAASWLYDFGNGATSNQSAPVYTFPDTGFYLVTQYVLHANGCRDSISMLIDVAPKYTLYLPNAFLPANSGENSAYGAIGIPYGIREFELSIYDRWGNRVFQSQDFSEKWDGRDNHGRIMIPGVYAVKIRFTEARGDKKQMNGTAILIK